VKAFLLAGGVGSRLRPITDRIPKCMIPFDGRPLLELWLEALGRAGVAEVLVNVHHLPHVVRDHVRARRGSPTVRLFAEPELLGSAGTMVANWAWVRDEEVFLACYADNLTDFDLGALVAHHRAGDDPATIAVFHADEPSRCGIVQVDDESRVIGFEEKPARPASDLANAGMYAFHPRVLEGLDAGRPLDIGYHLLPGLVGRARAVCVNGYFRDIGTPEAYAQACREWPVRGQP
jgi:mannose-1-phosphate guanylyltransferase